MANTTITRKDMQIKSVKLLPEEAQQLAVNWQRLQGQLAELANQFQVFSLEHSCPTCTCTTVLCNKCVRSWSQIILHTGKLNNLNKAHLLLHAPQSLH